MRDPRFKAEHRGGLLKKEQQIQMIRWACACVRHVFPSLSEADERLQDALATAEEWSTGKAPVGEARKASLAAIAVASESSDPVVVAVARAAGHAVATAHMADHSLGAALYTLKAAKIAGQDVQEERNWQNGQLPAEIRELVLSSRLKKEEFMKI